MGARNCTVVSEIVNCAAWSMNTQGQQTCIENLQCKSQERGHELIKDFEL